MTKKTYAAVRLLVQLFSLCIVILVCAFVFLRLYGVPEPLLREMIKRANRAGIPVDIEHVALTLKGWHASNVRYYSKHPDDLEAVFHAQEVLFTRRVPVDAGSAHGLHFDIKAMGISLNPSVVLGVDIPDESLSRTVEQADLALDFYPDRIESKGAVNWSGARIQVHGTVLKSTLDEEGPPVRQARKPVKKQRTVLPMYISEQQFQILEDRLKSIQLRKGADIEIGFFVNMNNNAENRLSFDFSAVDTSVRGIDFSLTSVTGNYVYPKVEIEKISLSHEAQSIRLEGSYDLETKELQGELHNGITTKDMLVLLPQFAMDLLVKAEIQFEYLPQLNLQFGPAKPADLLNSLDGSFSIRDVSYCQLVIDSLRGRISRSKNRLELTKLQGTVIGQEERAEELGSCMVGGSATGEVFWDANTEEFGVSAAGSLDPMLVMAPLARVTIATNVIDRFKFEKSPPEISLELGAKYTDWSTFYINIQGRGDQVRIHEGLLSSVNTAGYYKHGVLKLDPIAAMQGADFLKGTASIDFLNSKASFDARGSIHPRTIEDAIYPELNLFGHKINTGGAATIEARGILDWGRMLDTDFTAEVAADQLEIPVANVSSFSANVTGLGPELSVNDASFVFYEGSGNSEFSIQLDPLKSGMPYVMDINIENADFKKYLRFINPKIGAGNTGRLSGTASFQADLAKDFFECAKGRGTVSIEQGQLADLPLFRGFSKLIRKVVPGFNIFSITSLKGTFQLVNGEIHSDDAFFGGDFISAKAHGHYTKKNGFDAVVKAQIMNDNAVSKVIQVITNPIFKLFEIKLEGTLSDPSWKLEKFHSEKREGSGGTSEGESD